MIIQGFNQIAAAYGKTHSATPARQSMPSAAANLADKVSISDAARAQFDAAKKTTTSAEVQQKIAEIKSRPNVERSPADFEYLEKHDQRYGELLEKIKTNGMNGWEALTADELDYMQKASGMVNTMAYLSSGEKALFDEMVAQGNREAATGLLLVGMSRIGMDGQQVTLPNGQRFDPADTEVTAANVRNLFKYLFVDSSGNGTTDQSFEALASYLDKREAAEQHKNQV
ncbi:hypothetical protein [Azonexus sp.]|uniref:hypothetical protein n=1 Tax=Azonexus sp. TaxID=1872668 RepID=UPI0027B9D18C|nr:hypothetical protein [Azonexus sp.]